MREWKSGQLLLEEYVVEKQIGEGGMGRVWLVKSNSTGRQYAIKHALLKNNKHRQAFFAELQTWIDLPEDPNIAPCRFFRTVGDDVLIFADFVAGGSLNNWIDSRRLYEGDQQQALERILDIAIQFAWGLHCLHQLGLVHQDVKPGNVLISNEGTSSAQGMRVQVSDFGLARAKAVGEEVVAFKKGGGSILLSSGGYTPAYCSPEQVKGLPISSKTDVWSWGVSVLEMFTGEMTCPDGRLAGQALEQYMDVAPQNNCIPQMPAEVAKILKECFHNDPRGRWHNLAAATKQMREVYLNIIEHEYTRTLVPIERRIMPQIDSVVRRTRGGVSWSDPRGWLELALRLDGRNPAEAETVLSQLGVTRRGQLVMDLAAYDEAKGIIERLASTGQKDLEQNLASLCMEKASVHKTADDYSGALKEYDQCIAIYQRLWKHNRGKALLEHAINLAAAIMDKAHLLDSMGNLTDAIQSYDQCITIWGLLVEKGGNWKLADNYANSIMNKANTLSSTGDLVGAIKLYDQCIDIWHRMTKKEGQRNYDDELATVIKNKADALTKIGDMTSALKLHDQCVSIWSRLIEHDGQKDLVRSLARGLMGSASAYASYRDLPKAAKICGQCLEIWSRLVEQEGRWEDADELAKALVTNANIQARLGNLCDALQLYEHGFAILIRLVEREGRRELADLLAMTLMNKGVALCRMGDLASSIKIYDQCTQIYRRLIEQEDRQDLAADLADVLNNKAIVLVKMDDLAGAMQAYDQCIAIRQRLVEKEGRNELSNKYASALYNKASLLEDMGCWSDAVNLCEQSINILMRLIEQESQSHLADQMAKVLSFKASGLAKMGQLENAIKAYDECISIYRRLVEQDGRRELANSLDIALNNRAYVVRSANISQENGTA